MSVGDTIIDMPTDLRNDDNATTTSMELEPLQGSSSTHTGNAADLHANNGVKPSRRGILRLTVDVPVQSPSKPGSTRPAPRWRTPEFMFYGVVFSVVVPLMVWKPIDLSRETHPSYHIYEHRLQQGWLFGRKIDNSDSQYRMVRNNIPILAVLACAYLGVKSLLQRLTSIRRISFLFTASILFILGLHGANLLKILVILSINYLIAILLGSSKLNPLFTWIFNMGVLFAIERNNGYKFSSLSETLASLDDLSGIYPRWFIPFNISMLRLVSFNMDYHWAAKKRLSTELEPNAGHKQRTTTPHALDIYSFVNYVTYIFYPPLFLAGPIMTFNDFMWQLRKESSVPSRQYVVSYLIRFLSCLLVMEGIQHFMYIVAIKDTRAWQGYSPFELSMVGLWNLFFVWLKLLIPWRLFRLWALADGVDPPENMIRCMANNYSTLGFWRSWHRSYNLWIVRYIYIPLGGANNLIFTTVLIFSFVALWHDLTFRLLAWGWLVSLFILPEILARYILPEAKYGKRPWFRHACAIGGVFNGLMMVTANLVGFVTGLDGIRYLLEQLTETWEGVRFLLSACVCIFIAIQVMFEYREEEMRHGIFRKC